MLSGGRSSEHEVSVASARSVAEALAARGLRGRPVEIDRDGRWALGAAGAARSSCRGAPDRRSARLPRARRWPRALAGVDVVFPVLHGPFGEDGTVQGLLELAGVPYVGAGVTASALCMDKDLFKSVLRDNGIPVTRNVTLRARRRAARTRTATRCFVKPARLGSSVGISKAHDDAELAAAVALAFEHDEKVLVEEFVDGIEVEVGVLGNRDAAVASLPGEIVVANNEWYDYEAKYADGEMELVVPARVSERGGGARAGAGGAGVRRVRVRGDGAGRPVRPQRRRGARERAEHDPRLHRDERLREALRGVAGSRTRALLERLIDLALERHERRRSLRY